jgi:hypothetical protein
MSEADAAFWVNHGYKIVSKTRTEATATGEFTYRFAPSREPAHQHEALVAAFLARAGKPDPEGEHCMRCGLADSEPDNPMLLCEHPCTMGCRIGCLNMSAVPDDEWLCPACDADPGRRIAGATRRAVAPPPPPPHPTSLLQRPERVTIDTWHVNPDTDVVNDTGAHLLCSDPTIPEEAYIYDPRGRFVGALQRQRLDLLSLQHRSSPPLLRRR